MGLWGISGSVWRLSWSCNAPPAGWERGTSPSTGNTAPCCLAAPWSVGRLSCVCGGVKTENLAAWRSSRWSGRVWRGRFLKEVWKLRIRLRYSFQREGEFRLDKKPWLTSPVTSCEHFHFVAQLKVSQKEKVHLLGAGKWCGRTAIYRKFIKLKAQIREPLLVI